MGCSDVSEFEHIYGQIITTPSCVYGRLFTWTRMVNFNALIVWKTFIYICFSIKSSLWALTAAYTKFRKMIWSMIWSCGHRSRSPMRTVTSSKHREISLGKSWKYTTLWFPGGSSHYRCWSAILVTTAMTQPPPPLLSPSSLRLLPLPLFNEGLGVSSWENCGIKDVCRYVLEHLGGVMPLIIFPWNKTLNSPASFLYFLSPEDFRDTFCVAAGAFGRPWLLCIRRLTRHTQDFTMEVVHVVGIWPGLTWTWVGFTHGLGWVWVVFFKLPWVGLGLVRWEQLHIIQQH